MQHNEFLYLVNKQGISVIIPNYNGRQLLEQVLPTVFIALHNAGLSHEVIISDDASSDDSLSFLQSNYPQVQLICNKENRGFSPTINTGIFAAQYDYVLLLNSDVKLSPDYFKPLLRYFDSEDTFGVMGRIVGWQDEKIQDAAKYPAFHGSKIKTSGNYYLATPSANDWLYSMYLSGANALVDRRKIQSLGGFNELFAPFYVEDFELSLRAWRMGWKCYYEHAAICRHQTSTTIASSFKKENIKKIYNRNKMYMHAIHLDGGKRFLWFLQLFLESIVQLIMFKKYFAKALFLFLSSYKNVVSSRKKFYAFAKEKQLLSVDKVVDEILNSIKGKQIIRF